MTGSARALLFQVVDYAGTFPPARLDVSEAVRLYGRYRRGPHAWLLDRLVLPGSIPEPGTRLFPDPEDDLPWVLSVIVPAEDLPAFQPRELEASQEGKVFISSIEVPPCEPARIRKASGIARGREVFFEVPISPGATERLDAIAAAGYGAKVRTGGLEPQAFPSAEELTGFLLACSERQIPFKATAGLHHPFRSVRKLGEEAGGAEVLMHGFVNLAAAACLLDAGAIGVREVIEVLEEQDPRAFVFDESALEWRGKRIKVAQIEKARRSFFRSFGACSFEEPVEGLVETGVI
jgi:hypothetical protein